MVKINNIKDFIKEKIKNLVDQIDAKLLFDLAEDPNTHLVNEFSHRIEKIAELGKEIIPVVGYTEVISNDFWSFQDPGYKKLFPELTDSEGNLEFLICIVNDVKWDSYKKKIIIGENRFKIINLTPE